MHSCVWTDRQYEDKMEFRIWMRPFYKKSQVNTGELATGKSIMGASSAWGLGLSSLDHFIVMYIGLRLKIPIMISDTKVPGLQGWQSTVWILSLSNSMHLVKSSPMRWQLKPVDLCARKVEWFQFEICSGKLYRFEVVLGWNADF